jgi:hypothetical protein
MPYGFFITSEKEDVMNVLITLLKNIYSNENWSHTEKKDFISALRQYIIWELSAADDVINESEEYQELKRQAKEAHSFIVKNSSMKII